MTTLISAEALPPNSAGYIVFRDLEFLNRIDRRTDDEVVEELVGDLHAIEQIDVVAAALAVDGGQRSGLPERGAARPAGRHRDAVGQLRQLNELTAVERQLPDLAVVDDLRDLGIDRLQERRVARHGDRVGQLADGQGHWQFDFLSHLQGESLLRELAKPAEFGRNRVAAHRQCRQKEPPAGIRGALDPQAARQVRRPQLWRRAATPPCASLTTPLISAVLDRA